MGYIRKDCRKNVVELLKTISPTIKVFESRVHPLDKVDLPCIVVKSGGQDIEPIVQRNQPFLQKRFIETEIYCFARAVDKIEDELDDMALLVEEKISSDPTLSGRVISSTLDNTSSFISDETNSPIGAMRMSYISTAHTPENKPDTSIRN